MESDQFSQTDREVIANLKAAGYRIISVTKYPLPDKKSIGGIIAEKPAVKLLGKDKLIDKRYESHREKSLQNRNLILACLDKNPMRLLKLSEYIGLSAATCKKHLEALIEIKEVDWSPENKKYFRLISAQQ